ncbi:unnamed protein product [Mytilus coruscus]|uniref:DZIP3-like HEPN domain-containing protein n=1 Tax=Mytilus coruscus TaxID=42192 RepID=A0A6J8BVF7_MYTCO|nr:unnamed protein product [Mytilus coruscus]
MFDEKIVSYLVFKYQSSLSDSMNSPERKNYLRLLTFCFGQTQDVIRQHFERVVLDKTTFSKFLKNYRHELFHRYIIDAPCCECTNFRKQSRLHKLRQRQFEILYYGKGKPPKDHFKVQKGVVIQHCICRYLPKHNVDVSVLDITLTCSIVRACCDLDESQVKWLNSVREVRNKLAHTSEVSKDQFQIQWDILETAVIGLAGNVGEFFKKEQKKQIRSIQEEFSTDYLKTILRETNTFMMTGSLKQTLLELIDAENAVLPAIHVADKVSALNTVSESVGIVRGQFINSSCWRVGQNFIMTVWHGIEQQIRGHDNNMNENKLKYMTVEFCNKKQFRIRPSIVYQNKELDTVVLQLEATSRNLPPPLTKFHIVDPENDDGALLHLIAYPLGEKKQIHFDVELWTPTHTRIQILKDFCASKYKFSGNYDNDYDDLLQKDRLVVKCQFEHGASGCPGIMLSHNNNEPHVVLMFARGFPNFYYRRKFSRERRTFPKSKLLQQGISICSIYNDIKKKNPQLCRQIFEYQTIIDFCLVCKRGNVETNTIATEPEPCHDISSAFIPANTETIQTSLCELHKEHSSFFCCSHELIICIECVCSNHIKCPDILTVTRAAKYGLSSLIDSTEQKLDGLKKNIDFLMQKQIIILKKVDKQCCMIQKTMREIVENRTLHFDIETEPEKDLQRKRSLCFDHVKNIIRELNEIKQKIVFTSQDIQNKKSIENQDHAFCHLHDIKTELERIENRINLIQHKVFKFNWISELRKQ